MPWAFARDPKTGDRIPDGRGGFVKTRTAENLVRNQLLAHLGECWQDPELGSRLHDLEAFQPDPAELGADEARRALERVVAAGRIADLEVEAEEARPGRLAIATRFRDTSSGQPVATKIPTGG